MADTRIDANLRRYLWEQDPECFWCGILTIWEYTTGGGIPWNAATIDHYFSRYKIEERRKWGSPVVLACSRCNGDRGAKETTEQPLEEIWRRSKQHKRTSLSQLDSWDLEIMESW